MHLPVIAHLIITEKKYYSFKNSGLLDEIERSQKYVVKYEERQKNIGRKEGFEEGEKVWIEEGEKKSLKIGLQKGREEKAVEIAKVLKKKGVDAGLIALASGLSKEQIEKLRSIVEK